MPFVCTLSSISVPTILPPPFFLPHCSSLSPTLPPHHYLYQVALLFRFSYRTFQLIYSTRRVLSFGCNGQSVSCIPVHFQQFFCLVKSMLSLKHCYVP